MKLLHLWSRSNMCQFLGRKALGSGLGVQHSPTHCLTRSYSIDYRSCWHFRNVEEVSSLHRSLHLRWHFHLPSWWYSGLRNQENFVACRSFQTSKLKILRMWSCSYSQFDFLYRRYHFCTIATGVIVIAWITWIISTESYRLNFDRSPVSPKHARSGSEPTSSRIVSIRCHHWRLALAHQPTGQALFSIAHYHRLLVLLSPENILDLRSRA